MTSTTNILNSFRRRQRIKRILQRSDSGNITLCSGVSEGGGPAVIALTVRPVPPSVLQSLTEKYKVQFRNRLRGSAEALQVEAIQAEHGDAGAKKFSLAFVLLAQFEDLLK